MPSGLRPGSAVSALTDENPRYSILIQPRPSESDKPFRHFVIPTKAGAQLEQAMPSTYHVYILASQRNGTLYIGVTNDLAARIFAHRHGKGSEFTRKYRVTRLVHIEPFADIRDAITREKALKKWNRGWKLRLIEESNPDWDDLFETLNG
ncbi:GIY-YIG nuclease family protein [Parasphingorhabdus sp.]|jgi:putative endonuclease|uniref:GIY-YIG nuclease family protein n=1 Tax=Parasphingorhabdus sp. TaxID=2709688 RepID=UPI003D2E0945